MSDDNTLARDALLRSVIRDQQESATQPGRQAAARAQRSAQRRVVRRRQELREADYHQARLLLLIDTFSARGAKLDGLTKLAKLDFLLRYPNFLEQLLTKLEREIPRELLPSNAERNAVESRMIRYKYGPWDDRYYGIIGALVGRGLVNYVGDEDNLALRVTPAGRAIASYLEDDPQWHLTAERCRFLRQQFGRLSGNSIKRFIYENLPSVVDRPHRTEIV